MESLRQPAQVLVAPKTFYSKICLIELNSLDTMITRWRRWSNWGRTCSWRRTQRKNMNGEISEGNCCAHCKPSDNEAKGFFVNEIALFQRITSLRVLFDFCFFLISLFFQFKLRQQKRLYKSGPAGFVRVVNISIGNILGKGCTSSLIIFLTLFKTRLTPPPLFLSIS